MCFDLDVSEWPQDLSGCLAEWQDDDGGYWTVSVNRYGIAFTMCAELPF